MKTRKIDVGITVWKYLESQRVSLGESHNDILLRLLHLEPEVVQPVNEEREEHDQGGLQCRDGGFLPNGLKIYKRYKGIEYHAEVIDGQIVIENEEKSFNSPSMAAVHIVGSNTNGWTWWKYFDEHEQKYRMLNDLR